MTLLMDKAALRARCSKARYAILQRARPVLWKSGRRKGQVKRPGIDRLPFTTEQLWQRALEQVGEGVSRCPYCEDIGRPATPITLATYVWDHKVPVALGGSHTLDNLFAVCADCNQMKGDLSYEFFVAVMAAVEKWPSQHDRAKLHACLRTHGVSQRLRGFHPGAKKAEAPVIPSTESLALQDDF